MITLFILAMGALAAAGTAAGRAIARKVRKPAPAAPKTKNPGPPVGAPSARSSADELHDPIALGDAIVLDGGRGDDLWLARRIELREGEGDPFLVLFETDGAAAGRRVVVYDPMRETELALLTTCDGSTASVLETRRDSRPPMTLELEVAGAREILQLKSRRSARVSVFAAEDAESASEVASEGSHVLAANYEGGARAAALLLRDGDRVRAWSGERIALTSISVFRNRPRAADAKRDASGRS